MGKSLRTTIKTMKADLLTPVLIFKRLPGERKFLLESSTKYEETGRYSFIGTNPRKTYSGEQSTLHDVLHSAQRHYTYEGELMQSLKQVLPRISSFTDFPFIGGAVGYIQYDLAQQLEEMPALQFHIYETLIIFDHITDELTIAHTNMDAEGQQNSIDHIISLLFAQKIELVPSFQVTKITQDPVHLNPYTHRLKATFEGDAFELYRKMRVQIPGAYLYYIEFDEQTLMGASKKSFVTVAEGKIKAHAPQYVQQQNTVDALKSVATNIHGLQTIEATVLEGHHSLDVLNTLLPPLALQYATKIPYKKGFGSVVGYIGFNGQIDFTLAENVVLIQQKELYITANEHFEKLQNIVEKVQLSGGIV